ncbi:MAG: L-2-hydroxyglutarate dehydrogenase [Hyphomicrobiaceae bacterium hypho_1]
MSVDFETIVIGAGVVGLAIARALSLRGHEVLVVDQNKTIGAETSSRNSEVIHAGIYYPECTYRAVHCIQGKQMLYRFCKLHNVDYRRCGKLIVATTKEQEIRLSALWETAKKNYVHDLVHLRSKDVKSLEPEVYCRSALLSPSTGVINSHEFMQALQGEAEAYGAQIVLMAKVIKILRFTNTNNFAVKLTDGTFVKCKKLVLSAGLHATDLANTLNYENGYVPPRTYYAKGQYYALSGKPPFSRHIYPIPDGAWLGLHATIDVSGRCKFGPDIQWINKIDYSLEPSMFASTIEYIRAYYPGLDPKQLYLDYSGIRPRLYRKGELVKDFMIHDSYVHKICGLVMLFGIESPGLTGCLSIADQVASKLESK